jgi:hypothetical protein
VRLSEGKRSGGGDGGRGGCEDEGGGPVSPHVHAQMTGMEGGAIEKEMVCKSERERESERETERWVVV